MTTATINANNLTMELLTSSSMTKIFNFELYKVKAQDKDDVKQDCIIRILKALKTQEVPADKIISFCQTVIRRTVIDYYRKSNRKINQNSMSVFFCDGFGDGDDMEDSTPCFAMESDEFGYEISDVRADFELHRHRFTPTEQTAIEYMLSNYETMSMSLAEIANELQINKSHTTRAFKKLREIYSA